MNALVIPTIRENCLKEFLGAWTNGGWDKVIVVEDNPTKTFDIGEGPIHFAWDDIERTLGDDSWIISRKDSAIRSFGFLMAWHAGAEYILTLDDDCWPAKTNNFMAAHIEHIERQPKWIGSIPGVRTRGLPYRNLGRLPSVVANMGLWSNIGDFDAIQSLTRPNDYFIPPSGTRIAPPGQYIPVCGMNLCFKREVAPLFYFPLMGLNSPYSRFDDIFAGIIAKKILDHLGLHIAVGEPIVIHKKASNVFDNLVREAPGIRANEVYWEEIDLARLTKSNPVDCIEEMGSELGKNTEPYLAQLGAALGVWSKLFDEKALLL